MEENKDMSDYPLRDEKTGKFVRLARSEYKQCTKCKEEKPRSEFFKRSDRPLGIESICKTCRTIRTPEKIKNERRRRYGLTDDAFLCLLSGTNGKCSICFKEFESECSAPFVDHCHESGRVRGLLCRNCNIALGLFRDDVQILSKALGYLEKRKDGSAL
jgi:hypothetical protein